MKLRTAKLPHSTARRNPAPKNLRSVALTELRLKKILVPVDFSGPSRKALAYAVSFARQFHAEIRLLHVVDAAPLIMTDPMGGISTVGAFRSEPTPAKLLANLRDEISRRTTVKTSVRTGLPHEEIVRTARENKIDLIIIGRHGRKGLARLLIGSTAEHVLRHAPCPALVVHEQEHEFIAGLGETPGKK
jgi:universal stress protein A